MIELTLPWPPANLSPNARVHFMALARAKKAYKTACWYTAHEQGARKIAADRLAVSFTFYPPSRRRIDLDNCVSRMKAGIDALADILGVDDSRWTMTFAIAEDIGGMVKVQVS